MSRDPNDDRSDSMNPNNDAYWASQENHLSQLDDIDWNDEYDVKAAESEPLLIPRRTDGVLFDDCSLPTNASSLFSRCKPYIMDRTSRFLWIITRLILRCWNHCYETSTSQEIRRQQIQKLQAFLDEHGEGDVSQRDYRDRLRIENARKELQHAMEGSPERAQIPNRGSDYGFTSRSSNLERERDESTILLPDQSSMMMPEPVLETIGWPRLIHILVNDVANILKQLDGTPSVIRFTNSRNSKDWPPAKACNPGIFEILPFDSDHAALCWLDEFKGRSIAQKYSANDSPKLDFAFMIPQKMQLSDISTILPPTMESILKWLSVLPELWDIRHSLHDLILAAASGEWVQGRFTVFGIRLDMANNKGSSVERTAHSKREATHLFNRLRSRGYRPVILNLLPAEGPIAWYRWERLRADEYRGLQFDGQDRDRFTRGNNHEWFSFDRLVGK